jgi:hypothetical protein
MIELGFNLLKNDSTRNPFYFWLLVCVLVVVWVCEPIMIEECVYNNFPITDLQMMVVWCPANQEAYRVSLVVSPIIKELYNTS